MLVIVGINPRRDGSPMRIRFTISCHVDIEYARKADLDFYTAILVKEIVPYIFLGFYF